MTAKLAYATDLSSRQQEFSEPCATISYASTATGRMRRLGAATRLAALLLLLLLLAQPGAAAGGWSRSSAAATGDSPPSTVQAMLDQHAHKMNEQCASSMLPWNGASMLGLLSAPTRQNQTSTQPL